MKKELIIAVLLFILLFGCTQPVKEEVTKEKTGIEKAEEVDSLDKLETLDELPPIDKMQDSIEGTDLITAPNKIPKK